MEWLKIHHSWYHDILMTNTENLIWMKGEKILTLVAGLPHIKLTDKNIKDNRQFCSDVQCSEDTRIDAGFQFTTTAPNKSMMPQTDKQLRQPDKLKDVLKETNEVKKLMFFPPHGDMSVKRVTPFCD